MRRAFKNLVPLLLRHAAQNGKALPFLLQLLEVGQAVKHLLLGLIADGAGVIEDQVGIFFALNLTVALGDERPHDLFRVVEVHLATEGFDVKRFLLSTHAIPKRSVYRGIQSEASNVTSVAEIMAVCTDRGRHAYAGPIICNDQERAHGSEQPVTASILAGEPRRIPNDCAIAQGSFRRATSGMSQFDRK